MKAGGKYYLTTYDSPLGRLTLTAEGENLLGLYLSQQRYFGAEWTGQGERRDDLPVLKQTKQWLTAYFAGDKPKIDALPLAPRGSEFRLEVWQILREIPYGEVITYGEIASKIATRRGKIKMSAQAVGGAVGHNPISIIIPCHRVVGGGGNLTGYGGGIKTKIKLLELEGVDLTKFFVPQTGTAL